MGMFPSAEYPEVLVGLADPDDAAVYALDDDRALILTTDFFTPVVDDPFVYGAIAAANACSDVYAMGGRVVLALNIAVFPECLDDHTVAEILRGGGLKVAEAGGVVAGGHTIEGPEPIFGLAVMGLADRSRIWTKAGARPGDHLVLTKPLGVGMVTTALKADLASPADIEEASASMMTLNREAAETADAFSVHAATDVTGFSLLGHAAEMAKHSSVRLRFRLDDLPFVSGARDYAADWLFPAGSNNNEAAFAKDTVFAPEIEDGTRLLLFTPETSGGLLLSLDPAEARAYLEACSRKGIGAWPVGEVREGGGPAVEVV